MQTLTDVLHYAGGAAQVANCHWTMRQTNFLRIIQEKEISRSSLI